MKYSNIWNLQVGDVITFVNLNGFKRAILVTRVEEKSWYAFGRNSYGTLASYAKCRNFKIYKKEEITDSASFIDAMTT